MNNELKTERHCREYLTLHGYTLKKRSTDRDPYAVNNPAYTIIKADSNTIEAQDIGLDDVKAWCDDMTAEDATEAELAAFLRTHPGHVTLLKAAEGMDEETVAAVTCMAVAYTHGATDAEALDTFNKALAFYGRKPVTTGPKING